MQGAEATRRGSSRVPAWLPVFGVVFPGIVGGGVLVLPIALAPLGLPLATAIVVVFGIVNILTISALARVLTRSSASMPPNGRIGALVTGRLGGRVGALASIINLVLDFGLTMAYCLGLSTSLAGVVGGPSWVWAVAILSVSGALVLMQRRRFLMAAGTAVSFINIALLAVLILVLLVHVDAANLGSGPSLDLPGSTGLTLVLGAVVTSFYGHSAVATVAPPTLRRDPSGRALIFGCALAMTAAMVINATWVFGTLGAAGAAAYHEQAATGIEVVRAVAGPVAGVIASIFVLLALGMAGIVCAFVVGDLVVERLPFHRRMTVHLGPDSVLSIVDGPLDPIQTAISIRVGGDGRTLVARAWRGDRHASTSIPLGSFQANTLVNEVGGARRGRWLRLDVSESEAGLQAEIDTTMSVSVSRTGGSAAATLLEDSVTSHALIALTRSHLTVDELASRLGVHADEAAELVNDLHAQGLADTDAEGRWRAHLGRHRVATSRESAVLAEYYAPSSEAAASLQPSPAWLATSFAAHVVAAAPMVLSLALVLTLTAAGVSFAGLMSLLGIATLLFMGTALPSLLNASSYRRSDTPSDRVWFVPGRRVLLTITAVAMVLCAIYAAAIYQRPLERLAAITTIAMTCWAWWEGRKRGAFTLATTLVAWVQGDRHVTTYAMVGSEQRDVVAAPQLPHRGTWSVELPFAPVGALRLLARDDLGPARDLGGCRVAWPGGSVHLDPANDVGGQVIAETITTKPVTATWTVN